MSWTPWAKIQEAVSASGGSVTAPAIVSALGFPPCPVEHNHNEYQPAGSYAVASHNHNGIYQAAGSYAAAVHAHAIGDVTGLQSALDGKQAAGSYALTSHNHDAAYAAIGHNHAGVYQPAGSYAAASHNHDAAYSAIGHNHAALYAAIDHTHPGGGSDPWAYLKVASDFSTTVATFSTVTGLTFTPPANSTIEIEAVLLISTATATVGPRPGLSWGTGLLSGSVTVDTPTSATARALANGTIGATAGNAQAPVGGLPVVNVPYYASIEALIRTGASPQAINVQLASETAGTAVRALQGSFLKWRAI